MEEVPDALKTVISEVVVREPNAMTTATSTAIGAARPTIHADCSIMSSTMAEKPIPLPIKRSANVEKNWSIRTKTRVINANKKGPICDLRIYRSIIFNNFITFYFLQLQK